ncbi:hypothetical protein SPAR34_0514 [Streptococcus pneumoniae GA13856]|nr:hypothetical protein SPAR34_0514 [Streptococcus pneumoniae GA13856]
MKEREVLTGQRLNELEINGIRLTKFKNGEIGIEFISSADYNSFIIYMKYIYIYHRTYCEDFL